MKKRAITSIMSYTIILCLALTACTNNRESTGNTKKETISREAPTESKVLADCIQYQKNNCSPEMLERIAHSKDSIAAYMKQHPLLKDDPNLELQAEYKAVMWIKYRITVTDASMPEEKYGVAFEVPKECIREDGSIDQDILRTKRLRGELKPIEHLKIKTETIEFRIEP